MIAGQAETPIGEVGVGDEPLAFGGAYGLGRLAGRRFGAVGRTPTARLHQIGELAARRRLVEPYAMLDERCTARVAHLHAQQRYARARVAYGETYVVVRLLLLFVEKTI